MESRGEVCHKTRMLGDPGWGQGWSRDLGHGERTAGPSSLTSSPFRFCFCKCRNFHVESQSEAGVSREKGAQEPVGLPSVAFEPAALQLSTIIEASVISGPCLGCSTRGWLPGVATRQAVHLSG